MDMKEIVINIFGNFILPREHRNRKVVTIKQRWATEVRRGRSIQLWFRSPKLNQKPYLPEGFVEINKERFKLIHPNWKELMDLM